MTPAPCGTPLAPTDLAFALAARLWAAPGCDPTGRIAETRRPAFEKALGLAAALDRTAALDRLRGALAAQSKPDPARVHPSWYARALQGEPGPVRRASLGGLPEPLRNEVAAALRIPHEEPPRACPEACAVVEALAFARLVGDLPPSPDDPPAVAALTRFDALTAAYLIETTGRAAVALAARGQDGPDEEGPWGGQLRALAERFADAARLTLPRERPLATEAGLTVLGRLLAPVEPYRVRWALQHLPYPTARALRQALEAGRRDAERLAEQDEALLLAAWGRLHREGAIAAWDGGTGL